MDFQKEMLTTNAFCSTNFEAFDKKTPPITDFHDLILEEIDD